MPASPSSTKTIVEPICSHALVCGLSRTGFAFEYHHLIIAPGVEHDATILVCQTLKEIQGRGETDIASLAKIACSTAPDHYTLAIVLTGDNNTTKNRHIGAMQETGYTHIYGGLPQYSSSIMKNIAHPITEGGFQQIKTSCREGNNLANKTVIHSPQEYKLRIIYPIVSQSSPAPLSIHE